MFIFFVSNSLAEKILVEINIIHHKSGEAVSYACSWWQPANLLSTFCKRFLSCSALAPLFSALKQQRFCASNYLFKITSTNSAEWKASIFLWKPHIGNVYVHVIINFCSTMTWFTKQDTGNYLSPCSCPCSSPCPCRGRGTECVSIISGKRE
jgi:hypothetical protein